MISGGNTGADQAALRAAKACGLATGGYAPKGWRTESGPAPWLAEFGLKEDRSVDYMSRTDRNIRESDATLIFGRRSRGSNRTEDNATKAGKPVLWVTTQDALSVVRVRLWVKRHGVKVLNVAGNRENVLPGIGAQVEAFLTRVFIGGV